MSKNIINVAVAVLLSLGVTACSSGGSDQPGIDQSTRLSQVAVQELLGHKLKAQEYLATLKLQLSNVQSLKAKILSANTTDDTKSAIQSLKELFAQAQETILAIHTQADNSASKVAKASEAIPTAADEANQTMALAKEADEIWLALSDLTTEIEAKVASLTEQEQKVKAEADAEQKRVAVNKTITTAASYNNKDSIVNEYMDSAKREALLKEVQAKSSYTPTACSNGSNSVCHKSVARGTTVVHYNQAYSSYAVLRETYANENPTPNNAFVVLAKESDLTTDRNAVVDATYTGKASYSARNMPAVNSRDFTLTVKDDKVSGLVYQKVVQQKGNEKLIQDVVLNEGSIKVENGIVGFDGTAQIKNEEGTYKGVFIGKNAEEVMGTFETNNADRSVATQGAFAGKK